MSCKNCYWCRYSLTPPKLWKCKLDPRKRFNKPALHGVFCKWRIEEKEAVEFINKRFKENKE